MQKLTYRPLTIAAAVLLAVAAVLFFVMGRSGTPTELSPEAGFSRDMAKHHAQAVEMSFLVRDASTATDIRSLTYDIINTQSTQRGVFMGWVQQWGLDQTGGRPDMAWMAGHSGHSGTAGTAATPGPMPGMASAQELADLTAAKGEDAEILYLKLMIRHHEGGVDMAKGLLSLSDRDEVTTMAQHIVNGQSGEISLMKDMLRQRGAAPFPSILK